MPLVALAANAAITLAVAVVLVLATFVIAARVRRFDLIDSVWGLGFAVAVAVTFGLSAGQGDPVVRGVTTLLTVVWGVRLSWHIHARNHRREEDRRYAKIARRAGDDVNRYMLTRVYLVQAVLLWFVSLPVQFAQYGTGWARWPLWVGVTVWVVGVAFEAVGDHQLRVFHADPELLAGHLAEWFRDNIESAMPIMLMNMVVSETSTTSACCDGVTGEVTISKRFRTGHGDITLVLGAEGLDEVGFVTDFGDLATFSTYLHEQAAAAALRAAGPAMVAHLAGWFVDNLEPEIRGRLVSVQVDSGTTTGLWERGDAS